MVDSAYTEDRPRLRRKIYNLVRVAHVGRVQLRVARVSPLRVDVMWPRPVGLQSALRLARLALERDPGMAPLLTREPEGIPLIVAEEIVLDAFGLPKKDTKGKLKLDKKDKDSTEKKDREDKRDEKDEKSTPEKKKRRTRKRSKCVPSQEEEEEDPRCRVRAVVPADAELQRLLAEFELDVPQPAGGQSPKQ